MSRKNAPCLDCKDRCELCHKGCYNYKEYKQIIENIKKTKKIANERFVTHYFKKIMM